jgi:hypothetical protein
VLDKRYVGDIVHMIPYETKTGTVTAPKLSVHEGQPVELVVTTGPMKKPYRDLSINLRREYMFSWHGAGGEQHGSGGPQFFATTDASGRAVARTLPGKLRASIYTPRWRSEVEIDVREGEKAKIELHREVDEPFQVSGRLLLEDGLEADLEGAEIQIGAVDGEYEDRQTLAADKDGAFAFEALAAELGVFAYTKDGRAAGSMIVQDPTATIELRLQPTVDFSGRLIADDMPLAGHGVAAVARVEGERNENALNSQRFEARRIEGKTDAHGKFVLSGVPSGMKVEILADPIDGAERSRRLGEVFLKAGESRPVDTFRVTADTSDPEEMPLASRFKTTLRDCRLGSFHMMVILSRDSVTDVAFVGRNFVDPETNDAISSFIQLPIAHRSERTAADMEFLKERGWDVPAENRVVAMALDAEGNELGRLELDVSDEKAAEQAEEFIRRHVPTQADALEKWREAFAEAKRSGPCRRMARWLDDHDNVLAKDYVLLKVDDVRDLNGVEVAERLTRGERQGVPFHAVFDGDGNLLIDSEGPLGNIGHPSGFEGKAHLKKMLLETRRNLSDAEVNELIESLE